MKPTYIIPAPPPPDYIMPILTTYVWRFEGGKLLIGETKEEIGLMPTQNGMFEKKESELTCRTIRAESIDRAKEIINQQT